MAETERSLSGIALLEGLGQDELAALEKKCHWLRVRARREIIARDADSTDVYFVVRGSVRVVNYAPSGREISFDDIRAGGMFGGLSAIDGAPRSAGIMALEETTVATLSRAVFLDLVTGTPPVALAMLCHLAGTLLAATGRIFDLVFLAASLGARTRRNLARTGGALVARAVKSSAKPSLYAGPNTRRFKSPTIRLKSNED